MFKQLLFLDLQQPHDKQLYSLKRNQLIIKNTNISLSFQSMYATLQPRCYNLDDIISKIFTEVLTLSVQGPKTITATFNYNIQPKDIIFFLQKLGQIKMFKQSQIKIGHFQIKNNHISDYYKNSELVNDVEGDDLDMFEKQINNCLKLDRLWKINQYISYKTVKLSQIGNDWIKVNKFGRRTNEFFVFDVSDKLKIILIILPRGREVSFTKDQDKQIQELYIINKHSQRQKKQNIIFKTSIAKIINKYLESSQLNIMVNSFPQSDKSITDALKLSIKLGNPHQQQINRILQSYKKDKEIQLDVEVQKMKKKLRITHDNLKNEQASMQKLIKIYSKSFSKVLMSVDYISKKNIKNVTHYNEWIKNEIKLLQEQIEEMQTQLKQLHKIDYPQ